MKGFIKRNTVNLVDSFSLCACVFFGMMMRMMLHPSPPHLSNVAVCVGVGLDGSPLHVVHPRESRHHDVPQVIKLDCIRGDVRGDI